MAARSSIEVVPTVDRQYGKAIFAVASATAGSPAGCIMRVYPVGARPRGTGSGRPNNSTDRSGAETSHKARGWKAQRWKAARLAETVCSASAPPST